MPYPLTLPNQDLINLIGDRLAEKGFAQAEGLNKFGYIRKSDSYVIVSRENGEDTKILFNKINQAIEAVQKESSVYDDGPSALRRYGITHITSPIWAMLHLLTLNEIKRK